jgi:hypothetical protein
MPIINKMTSISWSISKHEQLHLISPMRVHFITFISYRNTFWIKRGTKNRDKNIHDLRKFNHVLNYRGVTIQKGNWENFYVVILVLIIILSLVTFTALQLIRFDQYFQGSTGLSEGYVIKLFHLIEVSTSFEGAFDHFRLCWLVLSLRAC